jgi:hypothetical protein
MPVDLLAKQPVDLLAGNAPQNSGSGINPIEAFKTYLKEAQPAFKSMVSHPYEYLTGQAGNLPPEAFQDQPWSDVYRQAGGTNGQAGVLPFAKSQSTLGQLVPEALGGMIDVGTRPSSYIAAYATPKIAEQAALNPTTRRWLAKNTPTLASKLLETNPVKPIWKNINGMTVDITQPLPDESGVIAKTGRDLVSKVESLVNNAKSTYDGILEPHYGNIVPESDVSSIPKGILEDLGIDPTKTTIQDLWQGRWALKDTIADPYSKAELFKQVKGGERAVMDALATMKGIVLKNLPDDVRNNILTLDPKFETIIESGKGLTRAFYDPVSNKIKTGAVNNLMKKTPSSEGMQELFNRLKYFDKSLGAIGNTLKRELTKQGIKEFVKKAAFWSTIGAGAYGIGRGIMKPVIHGVENIGGGEESPNYGGQ